MKIHYVDNLQKLHNILSNFYIEKKERKWVFRGQIDRKDWPLVPKAGRKDLKLRIPDENLFRAWKRHAYALVPRSFESDWEWLYIAQHHGLITRLLDWTTNPLAATFFAIRHIQTDFGSPIKKPLDNNVAVWAYRDEKGWGAGERDSPPEEPFTLFDNTEDKTEFKPIESKHKERAIKENRVKKFVQRVVPKYVTQRLVNQHGIFTYHDPPDLSLDNDIFKGRSLEKIIIKKKCLIDLQLFLSLYGINEKTMFPDIDGLSRFLNWDYREINSNE